MEIKFRGKREDNGEWVYGSFLYFIKGVKNIGWMYVNDIKVSVIAESVGQYTGYKDRNDKETYKGDIVIETETKKIGEVYWASMGLGEWEVKNNWTNSLMWNELEIIGNIHDNPELLEK